MKGKVYFILLEMDFFTIFATTLPIFFSNFTVSTVWYLESPPHIKLELFSTLVNGWNLLTIITEGSVLGVVEVLDMPLVSEGYVFN